MESSASHPPVLSENGDNYEEWKKLTKYWMKFTKLAKREQGAFLVVKALKGEARSTGLSIPEEQLDSDQGVEVLLKEVDKLFLKDKDTLGYECWKRFSTYNRIPESSILSYCAEFRRLRIEAKKYNVEMSDTTFAFILLDSANLSEDQKVLVLLIALSKVSGVNGSITPDHVEAAMKRIEGTSRFQSTVNNQTNDVFETEDIAELIDIKSLSMEEKDEIVEEALFTYKRSNPNGKRWQNNNAGNRYNNRNYHRENNIKRNHFDQKGLRLNPKDIQTGEVMRCHGCNSRFHLYRSMQCPKNANINVAEAENAHSAEAENIENIFASEADFRNAVNIMDGFGVVDSAATKTVCGKPWFEAFKQYLTSLGKTVQIKPSNVCYKFGNDGIKKSLFAAVIPICFFGRNLLLNVDVISSNCPLLMGRPTLERLELILNFKNGTAVINFSNGINEQHHAIVKSILDKIRSDHTNTPVDTILSYAIFAKNCLIDNLGYSAHQRVFGRSPNIPTIMSNNPCVTNNKIESELVNNHINMLHKTRQAYISAESSDRIKRALNSKIFVSESPFYYGERVYYWKESVNKTCNGWKGPGTIIGTEGKVVIIRQGSFIHRAHETRVRRCIENGALGKKGNDVVKKVPMVIDEFVDDSNIENIDNETSNDKENNEDNNNKLLEEPRSTDNTENNDSQSSDQNKGNIITLRSRDMIKPVKRWGFDEVYKVDDDENITDAKSKELESWRIHGVYKEVNIEKATTPLISTRWILTTKERIDKSNYMKARLVIRGFEDVDKDSVLSESPTAHVESVKVMLALLPTIGFKPKKMDISTAFLQGKSLTRPVFIKPPKEANVNFEKCWLLKGVYGLTDASRMWYERVNEVLINGEYVRSLVDPALYFKYINDEVAGIILCHVDDFLYAGIDNELKNIEKLIGNHFKVRTIEEKEFMFCGFFIQVSETENGSFSITYSQPDKISEIYPIETDMKDPSAHATEKQVTQFRSVLGALQWHSCNTRPDIAFSISSLLANSKNLLVKHCILANKTLRKAKASDPVKIQCVDLSSDANKDS